MKTIEFADIRPGDHIRTETTNEHLLGDVYGGDGGFTATEWIATERRLDELESSDSVKSNIVRYLLNRPGERVPE